MVKYEMLGFKNENDYLDYFCKTLLKTNWTYEYFVDWKKVKENIQKYVKEICLLNALTKVEAKDREKELRDIFIKYPETISVIPLIIAIREENISVLEISDSIFQRNFDFSTRRIEMDTANELVEFCKKVGLITLFAEINDLYTYLLGVEVGLDSNTRKNRSGKIFQCIVHLLLKKKLNDKQNIRIECEDSKALENKKVDFAIYNNDKPRIIIECNFYGITGSKPTETIRSYKNLQKEIHNKGMHFIWITDGGGWEKMKRQLTANLKYFDYLMNYTIASEKIAQLIPSLL